MYVYQDPKVRMIFFTLGAVKVTVVGLCEYFSSCYKINAHTIKGGCNSQTLYYSVMACAYLGQFFPLSILLMYCY